VPYRSARVDTPKLSAEAGIVDDMVRQFADKYAFLRELVQNGIDAGATRIEVRLERSPDGAVRSSVEDDGCGMTRAIIEGPLLTLFESSKEADPTKIGKYGIGFVSVFAIEPDRVDVRTRTSREAWVVRLFGDHSFELANDTPRPGTGTDVILLQTMTAEAFAEHAAAARIALARWCKHAQVPIALTVIDGHDGGDAVIINVAMTVPGVTTITQVEGDERFVVGVGELDATSPTTTETFAGFYNRGLTLLETNEAEPGLEWIRFKVDSPKLAHTLSRDNVRRDGELRRVLARVKEIVDGPLLQALHQALAEAAAEAATGGCERYAALLEAALVPAYREYADQVYVPLVDPFDGETTMKLSALRRVRSAFARKTLLVAEASSALTLALAASGQPVVRHHTLAPRLRRIVSVKESVLVAEDACAFAWAVEARDEDAQLCQELARLLETAGRGVECVRLAGFAGVAREIPCRVVRAAGPDEARTASSALSTPENATERSWGRSSTLFLNAEHSTVRLARRRARTDVAIAAQLLCRALLVIEGPLAAKVVDSLLAAASTVTSDD
jgi:hypothetical protein